MGDTAKLVLYKETLNPSGFTFAFVLILVISSVIILSPSPLAIIPIVLIALSGPNIYALRITITETGITLGTSLSFRQHIPWEDIDDCTIDTVPTSHYASLGYSIRRVRGVWRVTYNIMPGVRRVVLSFRKKSGIGEMAFSTRHPEEVMDIIHSKMSAHKRVTRTR